MSTFDDLHPRGNPRNAGQFRTKDVNETADGLAALSPVPEPDPQREIRARMLANMVACDAAARAALEAGDEVSAAREEARFNELFSAWA